MNIHVGGVNPLSFRNQVPFCRDPDFRDNPAFFHGRGPEVTARDFEALGADAEGILDLQAADLVAICYTASFAMEHYFIVNAFSEIESEADFEDLIGGGSDCLTLQKSSGTRMTFVRGISSDEFRDGEIYPGIHAQVTGTVNLRDCQFVSRAKLGCEPCPYLVHLNRLREWPLPGEVLDCELTAAQKAEIAAAEKRSREIELECDANDSVILQAPNPLQTQTASASTSSLCVAQEALDIPAVEHVVPQKATQETASPILAKQFSWIDPSKIPPRRWIYGKHYIRGYLSSTVAPGGIGKSALSVVEALSIVSGQKLLHRKSQERCPVWLLNLEDPRDELQRRIMAAAIHHGLNEDQVVSGLFVNSGRDGDFVVAKSERGSTVICEPVKKALTLEIYRREIGLLIVDPFVSCHEVNENDNSAINAVVKLWRSVAEETDCAIELVHHVRKPNQNTGGGTTVDDARGASALHGGVRSMRAISSMTQDEATRFDIDSEKRRSYFRVENGKSNMSPPSEGAEWYRLTSFDLGNGITNLDGDSVGVVEAWKSPSPLADVNLADLKAIQMEIASGTWRANFQSDRWGGIAVCNVLGLDRNEASVRAKVKSLLRVWLKSGALKEIEGQDGNRKTVKFLRVGEWATEIGT